MIYDKRKEIERLYILWTEKNDLSLSPSSMIAFFDVFKLVDEQKVIEFLEEQKENKNDDLQKG